MRLLVWASTYGQTIGGGPVLAPLLMQALGKRGHDIVVLTDRRPAELPAEDVVDAVRVLRFPFRLTNPVDATRQLFSIRQGVSALKRDFRPHLTYIFSSGYAELFHHQTRDVEASPTVTTLHDVFEPARFRPEVIVGRNVRASSWVCSCSEAVQRNARRHLPEIAERSSVILNALPAPNGSVRPVSFDPPTLLYVGRLVHKKGVDVLIAAMGLLRDRVPDLRLVVAGGGSEEDGLKAQADALGLLDRVSFVGSVRHDEVFKLYAEASAVVVPSRDEPFGLVALEAAHAARPVVASAVDGLPEVVADGCTGLLVPPGDASALAKTIGTLLDRPDRARALGEAGRERALRKFGWDGFVDAYEELFTRLTAR